MSRDFFIQDEIDGHKKDLLRYGKILLKYGKAGLYSPVSLDKEISTDIYVTPLRRGGVEVEL